MVGVAPARRHRGALLKPRGWPLLVLALTSTAHASWLDPHAGARQGNRLYEAGKYEDAAAAYNQALVDDPDSALLHFNLGNAAYKQSKPDEALAAFQQVPAGDADPARTARVAYNIGNTKFRQGEAKESAEPQAALGLWAEALAAYRRALGAMPDDLDAKFNHEFVAKKVADLQKKLEEQKKQQEQQQQEQDQQQEQQEQDKQEQQQNEQQQDEQQQDEQQRNQEQEKQAQQQPPPKDAPPPPETAQAEEQDKREMSPQEAAALLDAQRDQEVRPDEVVRKLQGAIDVDAARDW